MLIYVNQQDHTVAGAYISSMILNFDTITARRLFFAKDANNLNYLLRVHLAGGVSETYRDNTYIELLNING